MAASPSHPLSGRWQPALRVAGTLLLLAALFVLFPRDRLLAALRKVDWRAPAAALPVYLLIHLGGLWKWHTLNRRAGAGLSPLRSAECYFAGLFGTLFLPSLAGGDAVMAALAARRARSTAGVLAAVVLGRTLDVIALAALLAAAAALVPGALRGTRVDPALLTAACAAAGLTGAGAFALLRSPARRPAFLARFLARHREALAPVRSPRLSAGPLAAGLATQTAFAGLSHTIALACGLEIGFGLWLFAWTLAKLVAFLPIGIAGIGARELALAALLAPFGAPWATVISAALAWDVVVVCGSLAAGALWKTLGRAGSAAGEAGGV